MTTLTDSRLMEQLHRGDRAAFERLFHRHYDRVYGLLFRLMGDRAEAEDLTQEVFLRLYREPLTGRPAHNVGAWLYRVATNLGYNAIRSRRRRWQRQRWLLRDAADNATDPADAVVRREDVARTRAALSHLKEREVQLLLVRQMGFSYAELAEACDMNPASVGQSLARAAEVFKREYRKEVER